MNATLLIGAAALMTSVLAAGELDDRLLRTFGTDAKFVYGMDLDRYGNSALRDFFPIQANENIAELQKGGAKILEIVIEEDSDTSGSKSLAIFRGALSPLYFTPPVAQPDAAPINYKGVLILAGSDQSIAVLDPNIAIAGTFRALQEAIDRWQQEKTSLDPWLSNVRDLSRRYDAWFLVRNPLEPAANWPLKPESVYARNLIEAVEEIHGGITFGSSIELHLDAVTKSADDAETAAAIGRWLPGFMQLQARSDPQEVVLELAEDLIVLTNGKVASLSFRLSESRLRERADAELQKQAAEKEARNARRF